MRSKALGSLLLGVVVAVITTGCVTTQERIIWGSVIDNNNHPIIGAMVTTDPPSSSVATDNLGRYLLRVEPDGNYSVTADMLGYVSQPTIVKAKNGNVTQADIKLLPEGLVPTSDAAEVSKPIPVVKKIAPEIVETSKPIPVAREVAPVTEEAAPVTEKAQEPPKKKKWWEK